jgi:hypothetical protein
MAAAEIEKCPAWFEREQLPNGFSFALRALCGEQKLIEVIVVVAEKILKVEFRGTFLCHGSAPLYLRSLQGDLRQALPIMASPADGDKNGPQASAVIRAFSSS